MASVSLSASGIDFSDYQTPAGGMSSELLDHFEEGTWTPGFNNVHPSSGGTYIKVGKHVHIEGWLYANGGATGTAFTGLPFTGQYVINAGGGGNTSYQNNEVNNGHPVYGLHLNGNNSNFQFFDSLTAIDFAGDKQTHFHMDYTASA